MMEQVQFPSLKSTWGDFFHFNCCNQIIKKFLLFSSKVLHTKLTLCNGWLPLHKSRRIRKSSVYIFNLMCPPFSISLFLCSAISKPLAAAIAIPAVTGPPSTRILLRYNCSFLSNSSPSRSV